MFENYGLPLSATGKSFPLLGQSIVKFEERPVYESGIQMVRKEKRMIKFLSALSHEVLNSHIHFVTTKERNKWFYQKRKQSFDGKVQ